MSGLEATQGAVLAPEPDGATLASSSLILERLAAFQAMAERAAIGAQPGPHLDPEGAVLALTILLRVFGWLDGVDDDFLVELVTKAKNELMPALKDPEPWPELARGAERLLGQGLG